MQVDLYNGRKMVVEVVVFFQKKPSEQFGLAAGAFGTSVKLYYYYTRLTVLCPGLPGWAGTRKVKPIRILLKQETVSGSGISWPYASLHLAPER